jgi:hypothetical protein
MDRPKALAMTDNVVVRPTGLQTGDPVLEVLVAPEALEVRKE